MTPNLKIFWLVLFCLSSDFVKHSYSVINRECSLNGLYNPATKSCKCHKPWKGVNCAELHLAPVESNQYTAKGITPGVNIPGLPTWGGGAKFEEGRWHLIVGARAVNLHNNTLEDYPCNSKIVLVTSTGSDPKGPYTLTKTLFPRSSWEPGLATNPKTGELVLMFFGNITNPPRVGSSLCQNRFEYNLTTTNTYISVSRSGSIKGPWSKPQLVKGMINKPGRVGGYDWNCASGNPSPAFHSNGTLYAAMRHNPCWKGFETREHIGIWRADHGWNEEWTCLTPEPVFGWGGGSQENCTDENLCPSHEDPHLWWDEQGAHLLTHDQNNVHTHQLRGAYGWSKNALNWNLETFPLQSNVSAWDMDLKWTNGTSKTMARRQRPSFIYDPTSGKPTHLINGADFYPHPGPEGVKDWCEGCHWGSGVTLIQSFA